MSAQLLQIKDLSVKVEDKEILHNVDLNLNKGETHVLMGPNGAGKSTLGYALMGNPRYEITDGHIFLTVRILQKNLRQKEPEMESSFLSRTRSKFRVLRLEILSVQHWSREPEAVSDSGTFGRS